MTEYSFILHYQLPQINDDPEQYIDALYEAGCDDATVGIGSTGAISLDFSREATNAQEAVSSAAIDVLKAIPDAKLIEIRPDILNISEIAEAISEKGKSVTRQAIRKYATNEVKITVRRFPAPVINGSSPHWHLYEVLAWMKDNGKVTPEELLRLNPLIETSHIARLNNLALQNENIRGVMQNDHEGVEPFMSTIMNRG